ncbi:sugar ABC transporter substrate-binding lipoprotein UspC [Pseudoclavibacter endophyticus]|uniref:Extracellular solute-binding protein n=1 Tax=Pseudoclavibacter endophyticus TaxID=1778590 RepID=A0A6H9WMN9_9MICO|nr:extracellular solute-binding protein [Pseudoclavibacter endophyticus]KAB1648008.1 extracellular solute-binding protein [Pseudoclavibacter endophyticus]GGA69000.1 sugar ABC transporter substrate-binding lipoprotein UspC [Pseudoclavibacter endophyticus]
MHRRGLTAVTAAALVALTGCVAADAGDGNAETVLTLRLWDEHAAAAYEDAVSAFSAANPDIAVEVDVVAWDEYFVALRDDVASGSGPDVFWLNGSYYEDYADNRLVRPVSDLFDHDPTGAWSPQVISQYVKHGEMWGVPQVMDGGTALYYNADALARAGVTPGELDGLTWHPTDPGRDSLLPLLQRLTLDEQGRNAADPDFDPSSVQQWGLNAGQELQNVELNFIGSNGGRYQDDAGRLTLTDPATLEAYDYLVRLINEHRVAPPAAESNPGGEGPRERFLDGSLAVYLSGTYSLAQVAGEASFEWGIAELPAGPAGQVTTTPGVVAAANAAGEHPDETERLLAWLGSPEGNEYLASAGAAVPAVTGARAAYDAYWSQAGVDVSPFFEVLAGNPQIDPAAGQNFGAMIANAKPVLDQVFAGEIDVATGLAQAEEAANAVV